jgi:predicted alpha/beta-hydrolase family hydrolase
VTDIRTIPTDHGDGRIYADRSRHPIATLVLGHGASQGVDTADLEALAAALPRQGISVFRLEQPWRVAGRKVASPPAVLDSATVSMINAMRVRTPIVLGGRSAGARVACRLGSSLGAVGVVALAFPLHPPGRPDKTRVGELTSSGVPTFVVQGERDAFGGPDEFPAGIELTSVPEADHSFRVPKSAALVQVEVHSLIVEAVLEWVTARVG